MIVKYPKDTVLSLDVQKEIAEVIRYIIPGIRGVHFDEEGLRLLLNPGETPDSGATEKVRELIKKCSDANKYVKHEVIAEDPGQDPIHGGRDPYEVLVESGQVVQVSPGVCTFSGKILDDMKWLDGFFYDYAEIYNCVEQKVPSTTPTLSLIKSGYLKSFPQHALLVGTVHHDLDSLNALANIDVKDTLPSEIEKYVGSHSQVLAPTVCSHCFESLKERPLESAPRNYTAIGMCHRHEGSNFSSLDRLQTYTMREIVYFGDEAHVAGMQDSILDFLKETFTRWNMKWRILVASDPFFIAGNETKKAYQTALRLKYEFQLHLPFSDKWLAIASVNNHQKTLVNAYGISPPATDEMTLHSGCFGVGYERLVYGIYSQKGLNEDSWPDGLKQDSRDARNGKGLRVL